MADESKDKKRRLVKNPDTFRERAIKATEASDKPSKIGRVKSVSGKLVSPIAKPIGSSARKAANFKPLRLIGKVIFPSYFRNSWRELRQVQWPSWKQSRQLTFAVLVFAVIFGAAIAAVDYGLDKVFRNILLK